MPKKIQVKIPYKWDARDYQMPVWDAMDAGVKRIDCVWHRRAGKDLTFINRAVVEAHRRLGTYYHMMPKLNQARKAIWDGMDKHGRPFIDYIPKELIYKKNESEMQIEFKCGSIWQLVGADNYDNLMSTNAVGVVFSEYSLCNPKAWDFFRPIIRENGGWAAFLYTPRGRNHAYNLHIIAKNNPSWFSQKLTVDQTSVVTPEDIQADRDEGMTESMVQQEYYCSFDSEVVGALWKRANIDYYREERVPELNKVVVGLDPSATSEGDDAGIIGAGYNRMLGKAFVLADKTIQGSPLTWAKEAVALYNVLEADHIVAEKNNGGEMVETVIHQVDPDIPVKLVHASKNKKTRAEPVSAKYEKGLVSHVGHFSELEDQMCLWTPGDPSPNRMDALVWAITDLMLGESQAMDLSKRWNTDRRWGQAQ